MAEKTAQGLGLLEPDPVLGAHRPIFRTWQEQFVKQASGFRTISGGQKAFRQLNQWLRVVRLQEPEGHVTGRGLTVLAKAQLAGGHRVVIAGLKGIQRNEPPEDLERIFEAPLLEDVIATPVEDLEVVGCQAKGAGGAATLLKPGKQLGEPRRKDRDRIISRSTIRLGKIC